MITSPRTAGSYLGLNNFLQDRERTLRQCVVSLAGFIYPTVGAGNRKSLLIICSQSRGRNRSQKSSARERRRNPTRGIDVPSAQYPLRRVLKAV